MPPRYLLLEDGAEPQGAVGPIPPKLAMASPHGFHYEVIYAEAPPADFRAAKKELAAQEYDRRLALGFPVPGEAPETLQLRNATDRTNWFEVRDTAREMIAAGFGSAPFPLPIRTTANHMLAPNADTVLTWMTGLKIWGAGMQSAYWALVDAVAEAADEAAVDAIDVAAGWP